MKVAIFKNGILSPKALAKIGQNWPKLKISVFFKGLSRIGKLYLQGNCPDLGFECKESRDAKNFASLKKVHLQWLPFHFTQISVNSSLVCVSTCKNVLNTYSQDYLTLFWIKFRVLLLQHSARWIDFAIIILCRDVCGKYCNIM